MRGVAVGWTKRRKGLTGDRGIIERAEVEIRGKNVTQMEGLAGLVPNFQLQQNSVWSVYRDAAGLHGSWGRKCRFKLEKADLGASRPSD